MEPAPASVLRLKILFGAGQELFGGLNPAAADQAAQLGPKREKGGEENSAERAEKNKARQNICRLLDVSSPANAREP